MLLVSGFFHQNLLFGLWVVDSGPALLSSDDPQHKRWVSLTEIDFVALCVSLRSVMKSHQLLCKSAEYWKGCRGAQEDGLEGERLASNQNLFFSFYGQTGFDYTFHLT